MQETIVSTKYWHPAADGRLQCDVCPRHCRLREGQRGLCYVRQRLDDEIRLVTYGRSSGFCVDPIEKKPLNHFLPGTAVLSFGTAGCNLACRFCQNWDISKAREYEVLADQAEPEKVARVAEDLDCRSVAFTYNDPTIFLEYAIDVAEAWYHALVEAHLDREERILGGYTEFRGAVKEGEILAYQVTVYHCDVVPGIGGRVHKVKLQGRMTHNKPDELSRCISRSSDNSCFDHDPLFT